MANPSKATSKTTKSTVREHSKPCKATVSAASGITASFKQSTNPSDSPTTFLIPYSFLISSYYLSTLLSIYNNEVALIISPQG